jgi:nucleotide-binding universal stress UspA family protein
MIKRILVGLDPHEDTVHATDYAIQIATISDAQLTGLAVVDIPHIESEAAGGGVGSMYYSEILREHLSDEARTTANSLLETFEATVGASEVKFADMIEEGVSFKRIIEDMKYHDLLVVGREPHFYYHEPERRTETLERVVKNGSCPVLVVAEGKQPIEKVLIAYDGSTPAARTMQQFVQQQPFGKDLELEIINVRGKEATDENASDLILHLAQTYCKAHGFLVTTSSVQYADDVASRVLTHADEIDADLIVSGAHAVSRIRKWMFGSTTENLLERSDLPLYLYH